MPKINSYKDLLLRDEELSLDNIHSLSQLNARLWKLRAFQESTSDWLNYSDEFRHFVLGNNSLTELPRIAALLPEVYRSMAQEFKETSQPLTLLRGLQEELQQLFQESLTPELMPRLADYVELLEEKLHDYSDDYEFDEFYGNDNGWEDEDTINLGHLQGEAEFFFAKILLYPSKIVQEDIAALFAIAHNADVAKALPPQELQALVDESARLEAAFLLSDALQKQQLPEE